MISKILHPLGLVSMLVLAALAGCGKGQEALDPPTNFAAHWSPDYEDMMITSWTAPTCELDGYNMEYQVDAGPFVRLNTEYIHAAWTSSSFPMNLNNLPELVPLRFRMNTFRTPRVSAYSNVVTLMTRLRAPKNVGAYFYADHVQVSWTNPSLVADTLTLERGVASPSTPSDKVWTRLPSVRFGDLQYTDLEAPEGMSVSYRVTYAKGEASMSGYSNSQVTSISAPTQLVATPGPASVHLTWTNQTTGATSLVVLRQSGKDGGGSLTELATLPPTATSYDDLDLAAGTYFYQIQARHPEPTMTVSSPTVLGAALPAATPGFSLEGLSVQWPSVNLGALRRDGTWVIGFLQGGSSSSQVYLPSGGTWTSQGFPNATKFAQPGILLDASDQPHVLYLRPAIQGSSSQMLRHAWFDGSVWQDEALATGDYDRFWSLPILASLDRSGNPVVVAPLSSGVLSCTLKGEDGSWMTESLAAVQPPLAGGAIRYALSLDAAGVPVVAIANATTWNVARRTGPQTWQAEAVPLDRATDTSLSRLGLAVTADGDLHLLVGRAHLPVTSPASNELVWVRRASGTWGAPTVLMTASGTLMPGGEYRVSPAGDRIACAAFDGTGTHLLVYSQGAWITPNLGLAYGVGPMLGFTPEGKLRFVMGSPQTQTDFLLFSER
ncbi:fibronectin type III domain-containing protein [Mesoterricola sediminis]|uniref:Fibronectin type-III domain-containing protein n=1 Tax=Mesoterricola sediminis TaxID=2927980 RepID=A0AA48KCE6_9BACT|nr:hypothetical protein [Mesoterricola sediminis]BDU75980.1 hypothetical protein METESE_09380 [Mesoterricola sediminis]